MRRIEILQDDDFNVVSVTIKNGDGTEVLCSLSAGDTKCISVSGQMIKFGGEGDAVKRSSEELRKAFQQMIDDGVRLNFR